MDTKKFFIERKEALKLWNNLNVNDKQELALKFFPTMPFTAVDNSSSMIHRIINGSKEKK